MHFQTTLQLISLTGLATAAILEPRDCGETATKVCFGKDGGTSQNIDPDDLAYVAGYLRTNGDNVWLMPASKKFECEEWQITVPGAGTVLALAKHINPRINSGVTLSDMADTIDGGENASDAQKAASLLGCGTGGGMVGVKVNPKNPAYNTPEFIASKNKTEGIIIKIVKAQ